MCASKRKLPHWQKELSSLRGFTLIEVVVALSILALSLSAVYEIYGGSLHRSEKIRQQEIAWLTAQSLLDKVRSNDVLITGQQSGETSDGFKWNVTVAPYQQAKIDARSPIRIYEVTVAVASKRSHAQTATLHSLEIGRTPT